MTGEVVVEKEEVAAVVVTEEAEVAEAVETEEVVEEEEIKTMIHLLVIRRGGKLVTNKSYVTTEKNETQKNAKGSHERRSEERHHHCIWFVRTESVGSALDHGSPD